MRIAINVVLRIKADERSSLIQGVSRAEVSNISSVETCFVNSGHSNLSFKLIDLVQNIVRNSTLLVLSIIFSCFFHIKRDG